MAFIDVPRAAREFEERVISIDRVSRTVKGGKRMRFRALVVVGDRHGRVGSGSGKANEVPLAVAKATTSAKKHLMTVPIHRESIAHAVSAKFGGTLIHLWPATPGTSIIAGGPVRSVIELAGIRNILGKLHGSTNKTNAVQATLAALGQLRKTEVRAQKTGDGRQTTEGGAVGDDNQMVEARPTSDLPASPAGRRPPTSAPKEAA